MRTEIIKTILELLVKALRNLACLSMVVLLGACGGSGAGETSVSESPDPGGGAAPTPVAKSVTLYHGDGFECFLYEGTVRCRGFAWNSDLRVLFGMGTSTWTEVADGALTELRVWDDTVCVGGTVTQRPQSRTSGASFYCWGEATLHAQYSSFPIVYGGPNFTLGINDSPSDLNFVSSPFVGGDLTLTYFATQTAVANALITDGTSKTSMETLSCSLVSNSLVCPSFTVGL